MTEADWGENSFQAFVALSAVHKLASNMTFKRDSMDSVYVGFVVEARVLQEVSLKVAGIDLGTDKSANQSKDVGDFGLKVD